MPRTSSSKGQGPVLPHYRPGARRRQGRDEGVLQAQRCSGSRADHGPEPSFRSCHRRPVREGTRSLLGRQSRSVAPANCRKGQTDENLVHHRRIAWLRPRIAGWRLRQGDNVVATARRAESVIERLGATPEAARDAARRHRRGAGAGGGRMRRSSVRARSTCCSTTPASACLGAVEEASAAEVEALDRTNVFGLLAGDPRGAAVHAGRSARGGSSTCRRSAAIAAQRGSASYCSTKFAVEGLSEALAGRAGAARHPCHRGRAGYFRTDFLDATSLTASARPDRGLCRYRRAACADGRGRPQPRAAGRSRQAGGRAGRIRRRAEPAGSPAARQRHRRGDRGEGRVQRRNAGRVATGLAIDRLRRSPDDGHGPPSGTANDRARFSAWASSPAAAAGPAGRRRRETKSVLAKRIES